MTTTNHAPNNKRRRAVPVLWASGAVAAAVLVLGVNGTLSSWTQAIINNDHNDVASAKAVALSEANASGVVCKDTADSATNEATCSTINKYGGVSGGGAEANAYSTTNTTGYLTPGDSRSVQVTLANTGTGTGDLVLSADGCSNSVNDAAGGDTTVGYDVCTKITVSLACTGDATVAATTPAALSAFSGASIGTLAPGDSTDCTFTVELPSDTPSGFSNQLAAQALHWTLTAV